MPVYTIQSAVSPGWQPVECLYTRYNLLSPVLTTGCIVYTNIQPAVKPYWEQVVSCKRGFKLIFCYLRPIRTTRKYGPYILAVYMARIYGCIFWHPYVRPVFTGVQKSTREYGAHIGLRLTSTPYPYIWPVFRARIYGCIFDTSTYGPYIRAVSTGSAYRA